MLKVLLVDDEKYICKGLSAIIEKSGTSFKDIEECDNGQKALELLNEKKFDLMVTDIRMPDMDGITLIKHVQELKYQPKVIILSGYEDFNYAVEGLKYGAKAYFLKPVDREELIQALKKIESEIEKESQFSKEIQKVTTLKSELASDKLRLMLLDTDVDMKVAEELIDDLGLQIFKDTFCVCILNYKNSFIETENNLTILYSFCQQIIEKTENYEGILLTLQNQVVFITVSATLVEEMIHQLHSIFNVEVCAGVSSFSSDPRDIRKLFREASEAFKCRLIRPSTLVIHYNELQKTETEHEVPVNNIRKMYQMIGTERIKEITDILNEIFHPEILKGCSINYLEKTVDAINKYVLDELNEKSISAGSDQYQIRCSFLKDIYHFSDVNGYVYSLQGFLFEINDYLLGLKKLYNEKHDIETAIKYIRENYHKDISLTTVANHVSLNYSYLSYYFKEQTGYSFMEYLKLTRINKAKQLLTDCTNYKISEVAQKVGYTNTKQFTKIFRSVTGISPLEFKQKVEFMEYIDSNNSNQMI